ncbi:MAG: hypothetical protein GYA87_06425 [Christensenellaceae bacterium]|nr:hypothetical protein [Christensenellaceae bacterium]
MEAYVKIPLYYSNYKKDFGIKLKAKLNNEVWITQSNWYGHILEKHEEVTVEIIKEVLINPDFVVMSHKSQQAQCYVKSINDEHYRIVVGQDKFNPEKSVVITAHSTSIHNAKYYIQSSKLNFINFDCLQEVFYTKTQTPYRRPKYKKEKFAKPSNKEKLVKTKYQKPKHKKTVYDYMSEYEEDLYEQQRCVY